MSRNQVRNHLVFFRAVAGLLLVLVVVLGLAAFASDASPARQARSSSQVVLVDNSRQDNTGDVDLLPSALERISWEAVLAGTVLALAIQSLLNLLGISIGAMILTPDYGDDLSEEAKAVSMGAVGWMVISTLIALFIGGWAAARFAGNPDDTDAMLHGLMVWGLTLIVSMILLTTAIGRFVSGITSLIGQGMELAGRAAGATAQGVAGVAQGMATATVAAAGGAADAARSAAGAVQDTDSPEISAAMNRVDQVFDSLKNEVRQTLERSGISTGAAQNRVEGAAQQVQSTAQNVAQNPEEAMRRMNEVFQRIRNSGGSLTDGDRREITMMLTSQGNMSEEQARRTLQTWENNYNQARQQYDQVREQARRKADQVRNQAMQKVEQVKDSAERTAREATEATTKAIARLAGAAFLALVLGAAAAGLGGLIGAPEDLPEIEASSDPVIGDDTSGFFHYETWNNF